jgi:hypothetical protein
MVGRRRVAGGRAHPLNGQAGGSLSLDHQPRQDLGLTKQQGLLVDQCPRATEPRMAGVEVIAFALEHIGQLANEF